MYVSSFNFKSIYGRIRQRVYKNLKGKISKSNSSDNKGLAIVLLSGGLDSCVTTAFANEKHTIALLHVGYSQRTQSREYKSFRAIAN